MGKIIDYTGQKFGGLLVLKRSENPNNHKHWICKCDICGKEVERRSRNLKNNSKSCGCLHKINLSATTHGLSQDIFYRLHKNIISRCYNTNDKRYKDWGGRGITVCNEWRNNFLKFYEWAKNSGWQMGLTIDRINNDGNYEPSNCRWATQKEQRHNQRPRLHKSNSINN